MILTLFVSSLDHRVSFSNSTHGYVAGRKWRKHNYQIEIQSIRSGRWIPQSLNWTQYHQAVFEAITHNRMEFLGLEVA